MAPIALARPAHNIGVVEVVVLGTVGKAAAQLHKQRQLAHGGNVAIVGHTKEVTVEDAGIARLTQQYERIGRGLEPLLHK
jgi:hypothetical protein